MDMLACWVTEGPESEAFRRHAERVADYLWMGRDGMKMNGTNGSQLWDTSLAIQAFAECSEVARKTIPGALQKAHAFIDLTQIQKDHPNHARFYRDRTFGGWPFSTRAMGWIVADCTAEGLKAALLCVKHHFTESPIAEPRLYAAVDLLLSMQNADGGYATCEKNRGWPILPLLESFNASEVFGDIMLDYSYTECTSSCLQGLATFRSLYPAYKPRAVNAAVQRAVKYIKSQQCPDGSWEGLWGVCFTYGTWFAIEGLMEAGVPHTDPCIVAAVRFLEKVQEADGGWGESFRSCVERKYVRHERSQVVNTAWAVLALCKAKSPNKASIENGIQFILKHQLNNGDWAADAIAGVFNKNCMIDYSNYKNIFPIAALARFAEMRA